MTSRLIPKAPKPVQFIDGRKSAGILDDFAIRKVVSTQEGTIERVPINPKDIANKEYVDAQISGENHWDDDGTYLHPYHATRGLRVTGNVGIGTASPTSLLTLNSSAGFEIESSGTQNFDITTPAVNGGAITLRTRRNESNIFYLGTDGKVGIGTTSPTQKLHISKGENNAVVGTTTSGLEIRNEYAATYGALSEITFATGTSTDLKYRYGAISGKYTNYGSDTYGGDLLFSTRTGGAAGLTERMRINYLGNIGIGTTTPTQKLDVVGNINIDGSSAYLQAGHNAIKLATKGDSTEYTSVIIGRAAGDTKTDGTTTRQTALGYAAGYLNTGTHQTAIGYLAGYQNTGAYQTALGYAAGLSNTGSTQTALGYAAGYQNTGNRVTGVGYEATRNNTASDVVAIGYQAGKDNTVANQFIVKQTNINAVPLIQGDFVSGNVGIGTISPAEKLDVDGNINLTGVLKIDDVQVLKEQQAHIEDLKTDYTTGDLDTEAEIITAINTTNSKINAILAMLETHGLVASS